MPLTEPPYVSLVGRVKRRQGLGPCRESRIQGRSSSITVEVHGGLGRIEAGEQGCPGCRAYRCRDEELLKVVRISLNSSHDIRQDGLTERGRLIGVEPHGWTHLIHHDDQDVRILQDRWRRPTPGARLGESRSIVGSGSAQKRAGSQPLQKYPATHVFIVWHCVCSLCHCLVIVKVKVVLKLPTLTVTVNVPATLLAVSAGGGA